MAVTLARRKSNNLPILFISAFLVIAACQKDDGGTFDPTLSPCAQETPVDGCGEDCKQDPALCSRKGALFCGGDGLCTSECADDAACATGEVCNKAAGRCIDPNRAPDFNACADVSLDTRLPLVNVMLVLDQSFSMGTSLSGEKVTRWESIKRLVLGMPDDEGTRQGGIVRDMGENVRFGMAMFHGSTELITNGPFSTAVPRRNAPCPLINSRHKEVPGTTPADRFYFHNYDEADELSSKMRQVPILPELSNFDAINSVLGEARFHGYTPTAESLRWMRDYIQTNGLGNDDPTVFLLVTDGKPNTCGVAGRETPEGAAQTVAAVQEVFASGIETFVVGLANENTLPSTLLQSLANAGAGRATDDANGAPFLRPGDTAQFRNEVEKRIRRDRPCRFALRGSFDDRARACEGVVTLTTDVTPAGRVLPCLSDRSGDGWFAVDDNTIEVTGAACTEFQQSNTASVKGSFPCGVAALE